MKKVLIVLSCVLPMCLFGCASKSAPATNVTEAPQIEENTESATGDESSEIENNEETDAEVTDSNEDNEDEVEDIEENTESVYPELEELEEPVVITLEPPLPEEELTVEEEQEEPELVETELPDISDISNLPAEETQDTIVVITNEDENAEIKTEDDDSEISVTDTEDVIDITDDDASAVEDESEKVLEEIVPSRKVTMKKSEYLDIVYPGNGWVYMGLTDGSKDMVYNGRKLGTGQTKFTLQAKNAGTKIIHFYKEDNLSDTTLDDYLEVEILDEKGSNKDHITAPEYKLPLTKKAKEIIQVNTKKAEVKEDKTNETVSTKAPVEEAKTVPKSSLPSLAPEETEIPVTKQAPADSKLLLKEAQLLYNEKEYSAASKKLEEFFEAAVNNRDEGLYLQGQILEAKSSIQNIKGAIEAYTTLTKNYPASKYWDDANKRIIYLKRFYLEVR